MRPSCSVASNSIHAVAGYDLAVREFEVRGRVAQGAPQPLPAYDRAGQQVRMSQDGLRFGHVARPEQVANARAAGRHIVDQNGIERVESKVIPRLRARR